MRFFLLIIMLVGTMFAFEIKTNNSIVEVDYVYEDGKYITSDKSFFYDDTFIMVKFNEITPELISAFEEKYNLELQKIMVIGYYIYKSEKSPINIIPELINEENINTVKPKWKRTIKKR